MNEPQFANKIRQVLDHAARVDPAVKERLRAAREQAVAAARPQPAPMLGWADNVFGRVGGFGGLSLRLLVPALLVALSVGAIFSWQQKQRLAEIEEIDAELLTDDLPIDAYLDRGFEAWLKKRAGR